MLFDRKMGAVSWIIVFLGNPGEQFEGSRHNVGFMTADIVAKELGIKLDRVKFQAKTHTARLGGENVLLMKPQTFMNLSGNAVREAMRFYKLPTDRIISVSDDVALPVGKIRVRRSGSSGGHNGLKDIIAKCGGEGFTRVRIGVGSPPHPEYDLVDWVLSGFSPRDLEVIKTAARDAAAAVEDVIEQGVEYAMNKYN